MEEAKYIPARMVRSVENQDRKTSGSSEYIQISTDEGFDYLFTASQFEVAKNRAERNPEDVIELYEVYAPKKSFFSRFISLFRQ